MKDGPKGQPPEADRPNASLTCSKSDKRTHSAGKGDKIMMTTAITIGVVCGLAFMGTVWTLSKIFGYW